MNHVDDDEEEEKLEHLHYISVLKHFQKYEAAIDRILSKHLKDFNSLNENDRALIPAYKDKIELVRTYAAQNQIILNTMIAGHLASLNPEDEAELASENRRTFEIGKILTNERAQENIRSLLRQIVRDWSEEGAAERHSSYGPILEILKTSFTDVSRSNKRVLVPGAGLGRLVYEISQLGYDCQGNEFSLFMLLPSEWILNNSTDCKAKIYPWIIPFSNQCTVQDQTRAVCFPDILPCNPMNGGSMSMTAGDFLEVYPPQTQWDVVVTCFFLDTAKNVIEYIRRIHALLNEGGIWINHGPLLYHFEGSQSDCSIELSLEEIRDLIRKIGFTVSHESQSECSYTQDQKSMHKTIYNCSFMVMNK